MILFAPDGVGEVAEGTDLARLVLSAVRGDPHGPLRAGDIVVVTSKIVSKSQGRRVPAAERARAIDAETARTVARRGDTAIVRTRTGLTLAAAGVDTSNVEQGSVLLLPQDPDGVADRLASTLTAAVGGAVGVIISDTAGRPWRLGQTDLAIGAAQVRVLDRYAGRADRYGNELRVTETAVADELAAAAELVMGKLEARPVAVVRGVAALVGPGQGRASDLVREPARDMFGYGSQEAVLAAVCTAGRSSAV